ncbi:MAG TPA: hypothetical protein VD963_02175 [Phycisphaerales bacterium]|nr:hypothetical protein [Phycisphaerales bacterium]
MPFRRVCCVVATSLLLGAGAAAQPPVSPLTLLPGDAVPGPAPGGQERPAAAKGSDQTFVVWYEQTEIRGARLDAGGQVIDSSPIRIARDRIGPNAALPRNATRSPQVAWNGESWLVVYPGETVSASGLYTTTYIFGVRVAPSGAVLDQAPIVIRTSEEVDPDSNNPPEWPAVAAGPDGNWTVVWSESAGTYVRVLRAHRLSPAGVKLTTTPLTLTNTAQYADAGQPEIVGLADGFLLSMRFGTMYGDNHDIWGRRYDTQMTPLTPAFFNVGSGDAQRYAAARPAAGGADALIVAQSTAGALYGFRLPAGAPTPANAAGHLLASAAAAREFGAGFDGQSWVLGHVQPGTSSNTLLVRRYSAALAPVDPAPLTVPPAPGFASAPYSFGPAVAELVGGGAKVLWHDNAVPADYNVWGSRLMPGAPPQPRELVSVEVPTQSAGGVATRPDGSGVLVYWSSSAAVQRILAQRFDSAGQVVDPEPVQVAAYTFPSSAGVPTVACNGAMYMITWPSGSKAWARRLLHDGAFLDPAPVPVLPVQDLEVVNMLSVEVSAIGDTFLVAGYSRQSFNRPYLRYARVRGSDMTVLDPTGPSFDLHTNQLGGFTTPQISPVGTPGAQRFFVVYTDFPPAGESGIDFELISPDGTRGHGTVAPGQSGASSPTVAAIGDAALVVYREDGPDGRDLFARQFTSQGIALTPETLVLSAPDSQAAPRLVSDGDSYFLAWSDYRHESGQNPLEPSRADVWGARLDASGASLDGVGFPVHVSPESEGAPRLGVLGDDRYLVFYSALTPQYPNVYRGGTRVIGAGACPADFGGDGSVTTADVSAFLSAWFADVANGSLDADFDDSGLTTTADITAFLGAWFGAIAGGC